jgi:hypothetical protein
VDPRKFKHRREAGPPSVEGTARTAGFTAAEPPPLNLGEKRVNIDFMQALTIRIDGSARTFRNGRAVASTSMSGAHSKAAVN